MTTKGVAVRQGDGPDRATSLRDHLERGFRWMRFSPGLEAGYRVDQFRDGLMFLRINLMVLIALTIAVVLVDRIVFPIFSATVPPVARLGVIIPIMVAALALSFIRPAGVWYGRIVPPLLLIALLGIAWVGLVAWSLSEDRVFARLIIALVAVYFVMGLSFRTALALNVITVAFYSAAAAEFDMSPVEMAQFLGMLLMTSVICIAGAYNLEHARRKAWLEGELRREVALRDATTGIHNRRRFDEHVQRVWQQGLRDKKAIAMLSADIDCFKAFNHHYGHQAGDDVLKAVAAVQARVARRPFDMAARVGGEEFAVVLYDTGRQEAFRIAGEIVRQVRALQIPHAHSTAGSVVTVSIGVACTVPTSERDSEGLLHGAEQALYVAKHSGRDRAFMVDAQP